MPLDMLVAPYSNGFYNAVLVTVGSATFVVVPDQTNELDLSQEQINSYAQAFGESVASVIGYDGTVLVSVLTAQV